MSFHTWTFLLFFVLAYAGFLLTRKTFIRAPWLLLISYVFFGWNNPWHLLMLVAVTTIVDWGVVYLMHRWRKSRWLVALSVVVNLGMLAWFKYAVFAATSANTALGWLGLDTQLVVPEMVKMATLSFYIFQSLSYVFDYYRGLIPCEKNLLYYATFVAFFPKVSVGPLERAGNIIPQIRTASRLTTEDITDGVSLFITGLFKKLALADYLFAYASARYANPDQADSGELLLATFVYAWYVYFDFSGYTDMARGIARLLGFRIMLNFNNPYLATGLADFWSRWHISMSRWFRDYVYIPLGGNRRGTSRTYINILLTMVVSGIWHGAGWTFIVWGAMHGVGQMLNKLLDLSAFYRNCVPAAIKRAWVFVFVCFTWIFFFARDMSQVQAILRGIAAGRFTRMSCPWVMLALIGLVWGYQWLHESRARRVLEYAFVRVSLMILMVLYLLLFAASGGASFVYNSV